MKNKIKKVWVIEQYDEYTNSKKLLAILDARCSLQKIIFAMNIAMMVTCNNYNEILDIQLYNENKNLYPHQYKHYLIVIAESCWFYKAPYRAWISKFNIETGEYIDIVTMLKEYQMVDNNS